MKKDVKYVNLEFSVQDSNKKINVNGEIRYGSAYYKGGYEICLKINNINSGFDYDKYKISFYDDDIIIISDTILHDDGYLDKVIRYTVDIERKLRENYIWHLCKKCSHSILLDPNLVIEYQKDKPGELEGCNCGRFRSKIKPKGKLPNKNSSAWV